MGGGDGVEGERRQKGGGRQGLESISKRSVATSCAYQPSNAYSVSARVRTHHQSHARLLMRH